MTSRLLIAALLFAGCSDAFAQDKTKDKAPPTAGKPSFNPGPGTLTKSVDVALKTGTPEATIRYTLDGSLPTAESPAYSTPIHVDKTTTLTAVAFAKDVAPSQAHYGIYLVDPRQGLTSFHIGNSLTNTTGKFAEFVRTSAEILHKVPKLHRRAGPSRSRCGMRSRNLKRQKEWDGHLAARCRRSITSTIQPAHDLRARTASTAKRSMPSSSSRRSPQHSPLMQPWFYRGVGREEGPPPAMIGP